MERTAKIFISCALGALIGTMVALRLNGFFWWIGLLVGGLVGYLSYEFKEVIAAFHQAWQEATGWRLEKGWWEVLGLGVLTFLITAVTAVLFLIPIYLWPETKGLASAAVVFSGVIGGLGGLVLTSAGITFLIIQLDTPEDKFNYKRDVEDVKRVLKFLNPIALCFYLIPVLIPVRLFRLVKIIIPKIPNAVAVLLVFVKKFFLLIHSDIRLLCGVDAAIGTAIGYYADNVIIGMLAGGVFGIVNYQIISIKILRLNFNTQ